VANFSCSDCINDFRRSRWIGGICIVAEKFSWFRIPGFRAKAATYKSAAMVAEWGRSVKRRGIGEEKGLTYSHMGM
jgi:hypothetical protein